ncbi:hypothetical protein [Bacillus sp. FJAT-52991]|uniref:Uncharacterized protein n=1 Tax=Bacillus kandeliae TaxID=3129297 RepID=A0ABZ2N494_9BACI
MKLTDIQDQLNALWGAVITASHIDLQNDTVIFKLEMIKNNVVQLCELRFIDVSAFYYVKDRLPFRFNFYDREKVDYLELTSIHYQDEGSASIQIHLPEEAEWSREFSSNANIILEIWDSVLLIEAREFNLDGKIISLK